MYDNDADSVEDVDDGTNNGGSSSSNNSNNPSRVCTIL